jgi:uncharacterized tellurite resistance protein B-like protein
MMDRLLKTLIQPLIKENPSPEVALETPLAWAVLLLEAASRDGLESLEEQALLQGMLSHRFSLTSEAVTALLARAREARRQQMDLFPFTRLLNQELAASEKRDFMIELWQVVLADGRVTHEEDELVRKLILMLRLDRTEWLPLKQQALNSLPG